MPANILVIEDEPAIQELLALNLAQAAQVLAALEAAQRVNRLGVPSGLGERLPQKIQGRGDGRVGAERRGCGDPARRRRRSNRSRIGTGPVPAGIPLWKFLFVSRKNGICQAFLLT